MNIQIKKILNDLLTNPGKSLVVIVALVVGLWGVGSIMVSYRILTRDLNQNFLQTDPPQAILTSQDFEKLDLEQLRHQSKIESADFRDFASLRIEARQGDWIPLWLYGVPDFQHFPMARIYNASGAGNPVIPQTGTLLFERDGLKFSDLQPDSTALIRSGSENLRIPIAGICFDPAQAPGTQDHLIYGYVDQQTFTSITGEASNQRLLIRFTNVHSRQDVQKEVVRLTEYFDKQNITVERTQIPPFNTHPHQWQLNLLLFMEGSVGLLAFFMGAILVSQLIAAILASQIRQIGILKAIGGSRFNIFRMYLSMVLALGIISGLIAIPLAIKTGYAFAYFVAGILNFEILTTTLPVSMYLYLTATSLLLPVLLSLPTIIKGSRVSVRQALNDYGIEGQNRNKSESIFGRLPISNQLKLAFRNTYRRKRRLAVTIIAMALGVAIFDTGFNVQQSIKNLLAYVDQSMKHDVQVVLINQIPKSEALKYFKGIKNIARIETWNGGRGAMQSAVVSADDGIGIVALPYNSDLVSYRFISGQWLTNSSRSEIVLNQSAAELYNSPVIGSTIKINIQNKQISATLVGIVDELEKAKIYMDKEVYDTIANPEHNINSLMIVAKDKQYDKVMALKHDIEKAIEKSDLRVLYVMMQAERVRIIYDHLYIILVTVVFFAMLVLFVSAMGMASATSINIMERTREIGVLRAIGGTP